MGYYTTFELEMDTNKLTFEEVAETLNDVGKYKEGVTFWTQVLTSDYGSIKWYEHDKDMFELSKKYPDVVFTLRGTGEENDDVWVSYYRAGMVQRESMPVWTPPPFDPKKLRLR